MLRDGGIRTIHLPGGYVDDDGKVHREVDLAELTGLGEDILLNASPTAPASNLTTVLLADAVRRIGSIGEIGAEIVRNLTVQDREFLLVRLAESTLGRALWVRLECPNVECGEAMELSLALDQLPVEPRPAVARYLAFDKTIEFRLPTGADQEWVATRPPGHDPAMALLGRCIRNRDTHEAIDAATLSEETVREIEEQMSANAPDVTPELDAVCPQCRARFSTEIDMTFVTLCELKNATRRLEEDVHLLAWHYHWPERDILSMSRPKRNRYVRLIQDQLEASWQP